MSDSKNQRKKRADRGQEPALRCPRCDSPNTKFCYYNNYSLSQPRHFCKTCRRYWTKGGALRNVPIGGGCQKSKKVKGSSRLVLDSKIATTDMGGLRCFQVIPPGAMDMQLNFPRLGPANPGLCCPFPSPNPCLSFDPNSEGTSSSSMGLAFPFSCSAFKPLERTNSAGFQEPGPYNRNLESELQWKLQQQRLAMLVSGDYGKENPSLPLPSIEPATGIQKMQPIFFHNLEISNMKHDVTGSTRRDDTTANPSTEWFLEHPYAAQVAPNLATNTLNPNETTHWSTNEGPFGLISGI